MAKETYQRADAKNPNNPAHKAAQDRPNQKNPNHQDPDLRDEIRKSIQALVKIKKELIAIGPGKFEIHKYDGVLNFHMACVDRKEENGKMYISNYLNGIKCADCSGFELYKAQNHYAFNQYNTSLEYILKHSKIIP